MKIKGIYTPVVTPFRKNYEIDFGSLEKILKFLLKKKIHGIVVGGTTGEYFSLNFQERIQLFEFAHRCTFCFINIPSEIIIQESQSYWNCASGDHSNYRHDGVNNHCLYDLVTNLIIPIRAIVMIRSPNKLREPLWLMFSQVCINQQK